MADEISLEEMLGLEPKSKPEPEPEVKDANSRKQPPKARGPFDDWTDDDIENAPELDYLIGDERRSVLLEGSLWQVYGKKKAAKTFYCLEMAFCIAFGLKFHGMQAKQGQVVYILAEGGPKRNYRRLRALWIKHEVAMRAKGYTSLKDARQKTGNFIFISQTIRLADAQTADPTSPESFIKKMKATKATEPVLIVLDTWARALMASGGNENSVEHVGPSVQSCEMIRAALGGCALIMVAHSGVSTDGRAKGQTGPVDAVDGATWCKETSAGSGVFTFKATDQRHALVGWTLTCKLEKPSDSSPSVVLVSSDSLLASVKLAKAAPSVRAWLDALILLPGRSGTLAAWRAAGVAAGVVKGIGDEPPKSNGVRMSFDRAREKLVELMAVRIDGDIATVTVDQMQEADAEGDFEVGDTEGGEDDE